MAVSSLKGCWYKFSARVRDYLDVVDSFYRPADENDTSQVGHQRHHRGYICDGSGALDGTRHNSNKNNSESSHHRQHNEHSKIQISKASLPNGFCKRRTSQGQVYFVGPTGQKHWYDPSVPKELLTASLNLDSLVGRLSSAWEVRQNASGKIYYVNHIKRSTQFTDPRLVAYKDHLMNVLKRTKNINVPNHGSSVPHGSRLANHLVVNSECHTVTGATSGNGFKQAHNTHNSTTVNSTHNDPSSKDVCLTCQHTRNSTLNRHTDQLHFGDYSLSRYIRRENQNVGTNSRRAQHNFPSGPCLPSLVSGSHHNLSTTTHHSNTLTGPPTAAFKLTGQGHNQIFRKQQPISGPNTSNNTCSIDHHQPTHVTSRASSQTISNQRSGSVCNLFSLSANNSANHPFEQHNQTGSPRGNKELHDKIYILRQELLKQQVISHPCRIDVSRKRIFEESFRVVSQLQPRDLKKRLLVKFRGEEGLDYGGVAREWFYLLSREILNPVHGLFQYTSDDIYNLQINPDSGIVYHEHLSYLNFCGRVIGMAVFHGHFIEGHFTLPFYKMLLRKSITLDDIEHVDPDLHRSLCWMLENDITNVIDTSFSVQHNAFGQLQEHELKENGKNVVVTEANKHEYVSLYVNYRCRRGIESQFEALQRGFYELVSPSLVENFDEHELELLIGGLSTINIEDWRINTKLKNCTVESPLVKWFWDIVKSYGEDKRARLLQFVTGSPRVPIQGFKALQGVNSELRLFTIHLIKNACTDNLPKSHTCFNRIDLPPYETYEKLRDKLTQAIEETMGFAMQ